MRLLTRLRSIGAVRIALLVTLVVLIVVANLNRGADRTASIRRPKASVPSEAGGPAANSADRILFWTNAREVLALTDDDLARWHARGLDGFVMQTQWLEGFGSDQRFTSDPNADLSGDDHTLQRRLRDTRIVTRAKALGMKLYLGFYLANSSNLQTPLAEWFDDGGWSDRALPRVRDLAGAAKMLGFDGLALDEELYPQDGNVTAASWSVGYRGSKRSVDDTRREVALRGRQLMTTILEAFPGVELQVYGFVFSGGWEEFVQERLNPKVDLDSLVHLDFWDGMTSVEGYGAIRFSDAFLYKGTQLRGASWDTANQYNVNGLYARFSNRLSNWTYASSRVFVSPFIWIDAGETSFGEAKSPAAVADQLDAFRIWATGGELLNYAQGLRTFDYEPYVDALRTASTPAVVDSEPPVLSVTSVTRTGSKVDLAGTATDNLGIQAVRSSPDGQPGGPAARMTWNITGGDYTSGFTWEMAWKLTGVDLPEGATEIPVSAVDIKGLVTTAQVPIGPA